jgi:diguanylate cyclase (GGDEF)-like protein/PAS domain S-box-containing protein
MLPSVFFPSGFATPRALARLYWKGAHLPSPLPKPVLLVMPPRRRLVAAAAALLLTVGSGLLVGSALVQKGFLTVVGALLLVAATALLTHVLGAPDQSAAKPPAAMPTPFDVRLFERLSDPVLLVDRQGTVLRASASTARMLGYIPASLAGRPLGRLMHEDDAAGLDPFLRDVEEATVPSTPPRWRMRRADGGWHAVRATATSLLDEPSIAGVAIVLRDDTETPSMADLPADPPLNDALTGLATRALFRDRVEHALSRARRLQLPLCAVLLEFDDFRAGGVRATYEELELLLAAAATRVKTCLRSSDSAARLEGTRFGILLEDMSEERHFAHVSERLARLFTTPLIAREREFIASGNIGIASAVPEDGADELLRNADVALRAARRRGRGTVELYDPHHHAPALGHRHLQSDLQSAIDNGQLSLLYQPIVILRNRRIAGVEAFVRWQHPERGLIPAAAFIPLADEAGLIVPLGQWVLQEACAQLARWQSELGAGRALTLTVNVTARQLLAPSFVSDVRHAIAGAGIDPTRLVLEITEQALARNVTDTLRRVREVRALGVRFAIDDFGSRSATLGDPTDIPVDILKIDRTYISQLTRRPEDHAATRAIVALGRLKQLRTVAAGIEQEDQMAELLRFRCEYGQGALFSEPLDADGVMRLLQRD